MKQHATYARQRLIERMENDSIAVFFSGNAQHKTHDQYHTYAPQRNFFYLTNLDEPDMVLMFHKREDVVKTTLFIERNNELHAKWEGARMEKDEASACSGIPVEDIRYLDGFEAAFNTLMNYARSNLSTPPDTLYLDLYHTGFNTTPAALSKARTIIKNYPELRIANINKHLSMLRMVKTPYEIEKIRKAVAMTKKGLDTAMARLSERTHEYELAADLHHAIALEGSEGCAFETVVACGKNATVLHYVTKRDVLEKGRLVLLDFGALHDNYAGDISRTYPVSGTFSPRQKELYDIVLTVNKETIAIIAPGMTWHELNAFVKRRLAEEAKRIGLIENEADITRYYYHSIGHFLGLDVHDVGINHIPFEPGMVLTVEPGLYVAEEGIGIRIEDDILVTEDGAENLSEDILKETADIEQALKGL